MLCYAEQRLLRGAFDRLLDLVFPLARVRGLIDAPGDGSVDTTGFETRHISAYFVRRRS